MEFYDNGKNFYFILHFLDLNENITKCSSFSGQLLIDDTAWVTNGEYKLFIYHKEILLRRSELTADIINYGMGLIKNQYPNAVGLFNVEHAYKLNFPKCHDRFIQILHCVSRSHWIVATNYHRFGNNSINIYDSRHDNITEDLKAQICNILHTDQKVVHFNWQPIQQQINSTTCGIFSLAFTLDLLNGHNVTSIEYDERDMFNHLVACFKKGKLTKFPRKFKKSSRPKLITTSVEVHCVCRLPKNYHITLKNDDHKLMVCLDCKETFHSQCISKLNSKFQCYFCSSQNYKITDYK